MQFSFLSLKLKGMKEWFVKKSDKAILGTAVHAGHHLPQKLQYLSKLNASQRQREEDPLTQIWALEAPNCFFTTASRFALDLNRPRERAIYHNPEDAWGLELWTSPPPAAYVEKALKAHDRFYQFMQVWLEELMRTHPVLLVLDIHSYNHRRDGAKAAPADPKLNPDIDLGISTADKKKFAGLIDHVEKILKSNPINGNPPTVGRNIRYPDGGEFPEWIYRHYSDRICTITLEYKKIYMDEWTGQADVQAVEDIRRSIEQIVDETEAYLS